MEHNVVRGIYKTILIAFE